MSIRVKKNKKLEVGRVPMPKVDPPLPGPPMPDFMPGSNAFLLIIAPPGRGKSNLLLWMLFKKQFYKNRFDRIYFISPSCHTLDLDFLPEEQVFNEEYDPDIIDFIIESVNDDDELETKNILIIMDDCVSNLKKSDKSLQRLIFNRRHKISGGSVTIWMTSQKLNCVPLNIRSMVSHLIAFKTSNEAETEALTKQYIHLKKDMVDLLFKVCYRKQTDFLFINVNVADERCKYYHNFNCLEIDENDKNNKIEYDEEEKLE